MRDQHHFHPNKDKEEMMTKRIKLLMLAGTIGLAAVLTGCGASPGDAQTGNRGSQTKSDTPNNADEALKNLTDEIKKLDDGRTKAADDLDKIRKKISEKIKAKPKDLGKEISEIIGSDDKDKLTYLTELNTQSDRIKSNLEIIRKELKKHPADTKSQTSTDTAWDSLYYFGATLLVALFIGLLAGWGAGTLAAKKRLTKAGFW